VKLAAIINIYDAVADATWLNTAQPSAKKSIGGSNIKINVRL
jgi:hypothetical protein